MKNVAQVYSEFHGSRIDSKTFIVQKKNVIIKSKFKIPMQHTKVTSFFKKIKTSHSDIPNCLM